LRKLKLAAALLAATAILLCPAAAVSGAQRAMRIWFSGVAPALFPFLVLMPVLTGPEACTAYRLLFSKIMGPLFHLPGEAAPAMVIGMISGSPGGAIAISAIAARSGMQRGQVWRMAMAAAGVSPAYLIMGVGQGLYGSASLGMKLACAQICVQICMLLMLRGWFAEESAIVAEAPAKMPDYPVRNAVETVLAICGYMVFFSSVGAVASSLLGRKAGRLLLVILDLPSGLAEIASNGFPMQNFVLGVAIGFGGMCIAVQNLDALRGCGLSMRDYIAARSIAAGLMGSICMRILPNQEMQPAALLQNPVRPVVFSVLIAVFLAIPAVIYFAKKYVVNKTN